MLGRRSASRVSGCAQRREEGRTGRCNHLGKGNGAKADERSGGAVAADGFGDGVVGLLAPSCALNRDRLVSFDQQ